MKVIIKKVKRHHIREILVYGIVGGGAWVAQTLLYIVGLRLHIFPSVSMMMGTFGGFFVSYFGHTKFTFQKTHKFSHSEFIKFVISAAVGFMINVGSVRFIIKVLELDPYYGIIPTILTPGISFLVSKFWVFK